MSTNITTSNVYPRLVTFSCFERTANVTRHPIETVVTVSRIHGLVHTHSSL